MSNKLIENKRRSHAAKVLQKMSKAASAQKQGSEEKSSKSKGGDDLLQQYQIIKDDLLKLKDDLAKGYDLAKNYMDKKTIVREFLRSR